MNVVHKMTELTHPHIVRYFYCFYSRRDNYFNVVMEYASGGTLATQVEGTPGPTIDTIKRWLRETLLALEYMHSNGVLHRDIKPENILLKERAFLGRGSASAIEGEAVYEIKLADLSLAAAVNPSGGHQTKVGTDAYSSYEKRNSKRYGTEDDIWGLGCVFAELLTRRRLCSGDKGGWGVQMSSKEAEMQPMKRLVLQACVETSMDVGLLVKYMLRENPAERPSATSMLEELLKVWMEFMEFLRLQLCLCRALLNHI